MSATEKLKAAHVAMCIAAENYNDATSELRRVENQACNQRNEVDRVRKALIEAKLHVEAEERALGLPLGKTT